MAQTSILWTTSGTGDGASTGYTQTQLLTWQRNQWTGGANEGIHKNADQELLVSGVATPINIATGAAMVHGVPYWSDTNVSTAISTPVTGTRLDRIILRASDTADQVRLRHLIGTTFGGGGTPGLTQNWATGTWDIPLATLSITVGGAITVTDEREFLNPNFEVSGLMLADDIVDDSSIEISSNTLRVKSDGITNAMLRNSAPLSVIGRSVNSTGTPVDIEAAADNRVLARKNTGINFHSVGTGFFSPQAIATADIANLAISSGKLAADAVIYGKVAAASVETGSYTPQSIATADIANNAVAYGKIAAASVETGSYTPQSIATADIANNAVDDTKIGNRVVGLVRRQGGNANIWTAVGTNNYTAGTARMQVGAKNVAGIGSGSLDDNFTITFPTPFATMPIVMCQLRDANAGIYCFAQNYGTSNSTSANIYWFRDTTGATSINIVWMAIGPE